MWFIVKNLMLFDHFECHFRKRGPEVFIFDRFYKVFPSTFPDAPKRCFTKGFPVFCEVVKRPLALAAGRAQTRFRDFWAQGNLINLNKITLNG